MSLLTIAMVAFLTAGAFANTVSTSGTTFVSVGVFDSYNYTCGYDFGGGCAGTFPHGAGTGAGFTLVLPGLAPATVASATLSWGSTLLGGGNKPSDGDLWPISYLAGFTGIQVGAVFDPLPGSPAGSINLTDPSLLAALGAGDWIILTGNIGMDIGSPLYGNANASTVDVYQTVCDFFGLICQQEWVGSDTNYQSFIDAAYYDYPQASLQAETVTGVPEPSSLLLLGSGLFGIAGTVRRKLRR